MEVEKLRAKGFYNIREYYRNGFYATVLTYPSNEYPRTSATQKIMSALGWNKTLLVNLRK